MCYPASPDLQNPQSFVLLTLHASVEQRWLGATWIRRRRTLPGRRFKLVFVSYVARQPGELGRGAFRRTPT